MKISGPFEILGACRNPQGHSWGKWLRWRDPDGRQHTRHVADAALQGDAASLCAALADGGLKINRGQQKAFVTYLSGATVKGRVTLVERTGWHEIRGRLVFVLPAQTIGPRGSENVILEAAAIGPLSRFAWNPSRVAVRRRRARARSCSADPRHQRRFRGAAFASCGARGRGAEFLRAFLERQDDGPAIGRERVGTWRVAWLRSGMALNGERIGSRIGERDGHRSEFSTNWE